MKMFTKMNLIGIDINTKVTRVWWILDLPEGPWTVAGCTRMSQVEEAKQHTYLY